MANLRVRVAFSEAMERPEQYLLPDRRTMDEATKEVGIEWRKQRRRLFASEGQSGGEKWPELSEAYRKWKRRKYPGRKILARKGTLRSGWTSENHSDNLLYWYKRSDQLRRIVMGTASPIAVYHEQGDPPLPRRSQLQTTDAQTIQIAGKIYDIFRRVALQKVRQAARRQAQAARFVFGDD